jgi:hypothetical protein
LLITGLTADLVGLEGDMEGLDNDLGRSGFFALGEVGETVPELEVGCLANIKVGSMGLLGFCKRIPGTFGGLSAFLLFSVGELSGWSFRFGVWE